MFLFMKYVGFVFLGHCAAKWVRKCGLVQAGDDSRRVCPHPHQKHPQSGEKIRHWLCGCNDGMGLFGRLVSSGPRRLDRLRGVRGDTTGRVEQSTSKWPEVLPQTFNLFHFSNWKIFHQSLDVLFYCLVDWLMDWLIDILFFKLKIFHQSLQLLMYFFTILLIDWLIFLFFRLKIISTKVSGYWCIVLLFVCLIDWLIDSTTIFERIFVLL